MQVVYIIVQRNRGNWFACIYIHTANHFRDTADLFYAYGTFDSTAIVLYQKFYENSITMQQNRDDFQYNVNL